MTIRAITKQLDLWGSEAFVFEYLAHLYYYGQVWNGTMQKLGEETRVGSKQTVSRSIEKLMQMGLVEKSGMTIRLIKQDVLALIGTKQCQNGTEEFQHGTEEFQYGTTQFQNGTERQEKEKKQKNKEERKDISKDKESESNTLTHYLIILKNGYLHPNTHLKNMNCYYDANGWKSSNKAAVLTNWMRREQQYGHLPQLDERAAAFICDMVGALPDYQESFCDALEDVKIEGNKVVLYVPQQRKEKLGKWLCGLDLSQLMNRYQVEISIRAAG